MTTAHQTRKQPPAEEAAAAWGQLAAVRAMLADLDARRFLRGTTAWINEGFATPLIQAVDSARQALAALDAACGEDDEVGGLCFIGRAETGEALRALASAPQSREELLIAAESARERVIRVLDAVLAHQDLPAVLEPEAEGRQAASVRAMYARLAQELADAEKETVQQEAVELLLAALTDAVSDEAWALVRMSDRFIVEKLRRRALAWGTPNAEDRNGLRLVSDAAASVALLGRINLRPALVEHDLREARRALALVEPSRTSTEARHELQHALDALLGRDPELDTLAAAFARGSAVGWRIRAALESLLTRLQTPAF